MIGTNVLTALQRGDVMQAVRILQEDVASEQKCVRLQREALMKRLGSLGDRERDLASLAERLREEGIR